MTPSTSIIAIFLSIFATLLHGAQAFSVTNGVHAFLPTSSSRMVPATRTSSALHSTTAEEDEIHPAVLAWPDKYCQNEEECGLGPRVLHTEFTVETGTPELVQDVDALNWPTWTTADKEKWAVGNQVVDKIMPYGELSYMLSGRLEIIPTGQEDEVFIVEPGDFVTFPKGFQASWRVLEELTWHYFLY